MHIPQPSFWDATITASYLDTCISRVTRGNWESNANETDDIQCEILIPLVIGTSYDFSIERYQCDFWNNWKCTYYKV